MTNVGKRFGIINKKTGIVLKVFTLTKGFNNNARTMAKEKFNCDLRKVKVIRTTKL